MSRDCTLTMYKYIVNVHRTLTTIRNVCMNHNTNQFEMKEMHLSTFDYSYVQLNYICKNMDILKTQNYKNKTKLKNLCMNSFARLKLT